MRKRIEQLELFAGLPGERLDELARAATELEAPAGQVLLERGHPASGLFVLEEGTVAAEHDRAECSDDHERDTAEDGGLHQTAMDVGAGDDGRQGQ